MTLHDNPLFRFELDKGNRILRFIWSERTASMTDEDFKKALSMYADFAEKFQAHGLLVDVRNFKHRPGPEIGKWRDENILPRYVKAGVKKFAYVVGETSPMSSSGTASTLPVATSYFGTTAKAEDWLKADSGA